MAYDEKLVGRVRKVLARGKALTEKKMFGGLTFMMQGNMCCGVTKNDDLVLRLGPERSEQALKQQHVRSCDFTGRRLKSMVIVEPAGYTTDSSLRKWVKQAADFASSLPAK